MIDVARRYAPVRWSGLRRLEPVSRKFGLDRGLPIDRHFIEIFIKQHRDDMRGNVLEVGDSFYTKKFGSENVVCGDVLHVTKDNPDATLVGNLATGEGIPENRYDCLIATQTLGMIEDFHAAITGIHHSLKNDGAALITVSGISQISRYDMDRWGEFWRFTSLSMERSFGKVFGEANVEVVTYGNVLTACAFLQGLATHEIRADELAHHDPDYQVVIAVRAIKREVHK